MANGGGTGVRCGAVGMLLCAVGLAGLAGIAVLGTGGAVLAQSTPVPTEEPIPTLHVYANLIQVPTLVLGPKRERLKTPVAPDRFSVSIDSGPWFRATHVRQEGDDPISLSIVLDVQGASELMGKMNAAVAALAPNALSAKDRVSIYSINCSLVQSLNDAPASSEALRVGANEALATWMDPNVKCAQTVHLWDALAHVVADMSKLPGRRVILAVSDGYDTTSEHTWNEVNNLAQAAGVAVFGLTYVPSHRDVSEPSKLMWSSEDPFHSLCELSGGMVLLSAPSTLDFSLQRFVTLVRERYIVEFPPPANGTAGVHVKEIKIARSKDFIRPAGVSVHIPDPAVLADPSTVRSDPSHTPVVGTRRPMTVPQ